MVLSFIVAVSDNNAIGRHNALPWHLPQDLKFFKRTTLGKPVIMGRKTFEALGKPLPGRLNVIISNNKDFPLPEGVERCDTITGAIDLAQKSESEEIFIIGGGQIFSAALPLADRLYITRVHATIPDADAFFPDIDHTHWKMVWEEKHLADEQHKYDYTFQQFERREM